MGELVVVGTGIRAGVQLTPEARRHIVSADQVFYVVSDPLTSRLIEDLNPNAVSLHDRYAADKDRADTYAEMVDAILAPIRRGKTVCAAFYGHPGVLVTPGHAAVRRARKEGHQARMLPGVSAEACLFADLGVDPGEAGWQSYTAEDFLIRPRRFDTSTPLMLWQIIAVGDPAMRENRDPRGVRALADLLAGHYGPDHELVLYTAAVYPVGAPSVQRVTVGELASVAIPELASLYVPPLGEPRTDSTVLDQLGRSAEISESSGTAE